MKILDIDLDFFLNHKYFGTVTNIKRLSGKNFKPWSTSAVENFLETNCGLEKSAKIPGKVFIHHDELFYFLRKLQEDASFSLTFDIDHIDAHGDLGTGDASYKYIATSILEKSIKSRAYPEKINGWEGLSAGNFLAFAIACRWVTNLNYITKIEWADDTQWFNFKDFDPATNLIQLKQFSEDQMKTIIFENKGDMRTMAKSLAPIAYEPIIPFNVVDYNKFKNSEKYDLIFLTQSPGFTPKKSDDLIPIIQQYMDIYFE